MSDCIDLFWLKINQFNNPWDYIGDRHIDEILNHREDGKLFSDTMEYLKKNPDIKYKQIKLSCGEEIYLSIQ